MPKSIKKRPAAALMEPGADVLATSKVPSGPQLPPWANHCAAILPGLGKLKHRFGRELNITLWSDCGGMQVEMFALHEIAQAMKQQFDLSITLKDFCYCDSDPHAIKFAERNHNPLHIADDIMKRDFHGGTFDCEACGESHALPQTGVDVYVCCFPCGPWSADADGQICWQALKTIQYMKPCVFAMENVLRLDEHVSSEHVATQTDLQHIVDAMNAELSDLYTILILKSIDPTLAGFPVHKNRVAILGARKDVANESALADAVNLLIGTPVPVQYNWRQLIGRSTANIPWERLWQLQNPEERLAIIQSGCTCGLDPMINCPKHPCKCRCCSNATGAMCQWRKLHVETLNTVANKGSMSYDELVMMYKDRLSYVSLIEMHGHDAPTSCRERSMLNIYAIFPELHPFGETPSVLDRSQSINRSGLRTDGTIGMMATNAVMWTFADASVLSIEEKLKLMGHGPIDIMGFSPAQLKRMLGMSLHVGTAGLLMSILLSSLSSPR